MSLALALLFGITTGVLGNVATHFFITVWLPSYRRYVYRGVRISGDWVLEQDTAVVDGGTLKEQWDLTAHFEQSAYLISGTATAFNIRDNACRDVIHYSVSGNIYDRFVVLTLLNKDDSRDRIFIISGRGEGRRTPDDGLPVVLWSLQRRGSRSGMRLEKEGAFER